uniref:Polyadenylate-binding protein, cytoplasmic and nuclear n=1 Tax=Lygus hesperus TaxID=30085 RepID=A0A0A9XBK0_LYGHE
MNDEELRSLFAPYGQILTSAIMRNIHTGVSLGTAFVRYYTHEQASRAMNSFAARKRMMNNLPGYPRQISVQWANRQHDRAPAGEARRRIKKLFIRNIPRDVTEAKL